MSDDGLYAAMVMAHSMFEQASRRSGRTERMLAAARDGDVIITSSHQEKRRLQHLLRDMEKAGVDVVVMRPDQDPMWRRGTNPNGATIFDHTWMIAYWRHALDRTRSQIAGFEAAMSAFERPRPSPSDMARRFERWDRSEIYDPR